MDTREIFHFLDHVTASSHTYASPLRAARGSLAGWRAAAGMLAARCARALLALAPGRAETQLRLDRQRLAALQRQSVHALSVPQLHERARLAAALQGTEDAKEVLLHLKARPAGPFPHAELLHGRLLLAEGDDRGLFLFEIAAMYEGTLTDVAAEEGQRFLRRRYGRHAAELWAANLRSRTA